MKFKKPKFWDLKKTSLLSFILLPLTLPLRINNFFLNFKPKKNNSVKTICVGNIYLGGTGKTPTTIKLYEILKELNYNVSTGKKFYKSQSDENEILQKKTELISGTSRPKILELASINKKNCVVFDDGLQDRTISYNIEFVCFDTKNFIGNSCLIPSGPLREKINSLKKYDGVFLKSNNEIAETQINIIKEINPKIKIFKTYYEITNLNKFNLNDKYLIVSGIGSPETFKSTLIKNNFNILDEIIFPDHYEYKQNDIDFISNKAKKIHAKIITTEKDFVKISKLDYKDIDYIEIQLKIDNEKNLKNFLEIKFDE